MIPKITASTVYSTLGNSNSLVPLAIKDVANSVGLTTGSYLMGDKTEGENRLIDEFGTQAIWLFGIPVFKKVCDATLFKFSNLDSKVDVRILKNKDIFEKAKEFAQGDIKESLKAVEKNQKLFKGLTLAKFGISTALTALAYFGLTKFRHNYIKGKTNGHDGQNTVVLPSGNVITTSAAVPFSSAFSDVHKQQKPVTFTGGLQEFMFNPVKNLMIVDGVITGERLAHAMGPNDFMGYVVKEGMFWGFMYFAGDKIKAFLENRAEKKHGKSIDLDARVIESKELKEAFANGTLAKHLEKFPIKGSDVEIYEFLHKNPDNLVVKFSKMSDVIETLPEKTDATGFKAFWQKLTSTTPKSDVIDHRRYIDLSEDGGVKSIANKLEKLKKQYENSGQSVDDFLGQVRKLKRSSVIKNMGACIFALGVIVPAVIALGDFQVSKDLKNKQK